VTTAFPKLHASGNRYGALPEPACKEQLSIAYLQAVATASRCAVESTRVDFNGVDATLESFQGDFDHPYPAIKVQLKCTSRPAKTKQTDIPWQLSRSQYDQLRSPKVQVPRILIVMTCPETVGDWVSQDDDALSVAHAAYWVSLHGAPAIDPGTKSTVVKVPKSQPFNVDHLLAIMSRVGNGEVI